MLRLTQGSSSHWREVRIRLICQDPLFSVRCPRCFSPFSVSWLYFARFLQLRPPGSKWIDWNQGGITVLFYTQFPGEWFLHQIMARDCDEKILETIHVFFSKSSTEPFFQRSWHVSDREREEQDRWQWKDERRTSDWWSVWSRFFVTLVHVCTTLTSHPFMYHIHTYVLYISYGWTSLCTFCIDNTCIFIYII